MLGVSVIKPLLPRVEVLVLKHWQEQLRYGRLSWIEVSLPWKTEYPEGCSTAMRCVVRKVATMKGGLVWFEGGFTTGTLFLDRWTCIWQYPPLRTEPSKFYEVYPRIPWWYLGQQYINRKKSFLLLFLYHYVFPHPLRPFPEWHWNTWGAALGDAMTA